MQYNEQKKQNEVFNKCYKLIDDWAVSVMQQLGVEFNPQGKNAPYLQLLNHQKKMIHPKPRKVSQSTKFNITEENQKGFNNLSKEITLGHDINKYLSKLIMKGHLADGMLDHFGCKHFHLGKKKKGNFIKRTGEIALAFVTEDEIFFIESKQHGSDHNLIWYEQSVIEILHQERPDLIESFKAREFINITPNYSTPEDLKKMRDLNINTYIIVADGTGYSPINLGTTTAGLSFEFTQRYIQNAKGIFKTVYNHLNNFYNYHQGKINIINIDLYDLRSSNLKDFNQFKLDVYYIKNNQLFKFNQEFNFDKNNK